jgi:hypothetical protein
MEVGGGSWSEADKSMKPYLENKLIAKGLEEWLKWYSSCLGKCETLSPILSSTKNKDPQTKINDV